MIGEFTDALDHRGYFANPVVTRLHHALCGWPHPPLARLGYRRGPDTDAPGPPTHLDRAA